ncbi:MAG: hypothetical protein NVV74_12290 [Magnetospirillum sp.]|nr:hypothetical protein [Magnetospirillum sp.]
MKYAFIATALLLAVAAPHAQAQLVGNDGWSYQSANRSFHAQGQLLRKQMSATAASSAGSAGATVVNNSTTIGNYEQISQILSEGATANLNTNSSQSTSGSQSSTATGGGNGGNNNTYPTGGGQ